MNKTELTNLLIGLLALAYTAGILQPFNQDPVPEPVPVPVPYVLCVPQPPATQPACSGSDPGKARTWLPLHVGQMPLTREDRGLLETFVSGPMFF